MKKSVLFFSALSAAVCLSFTSCASLEIDLFDIPDNIQKISRDVENVSSAVNTISEASQELSPEDEYYLGRTAAACIISNNNGLYENNAKVKYLNKICGALTIYSEKPYLYKGYKVAILNTNDLNAISTPGGHIFISKGLFQMVDSEDALAAILAHEIAHIQLNHSEDAIRVSRTTNAVTELLATADNYTTKSLSQESELMLAMSMAYVDVVVTSGFSSEQELEADKYALTLLADAGYDPKAMAEMLELLRKKQTGDTTLDRNHPSPKVRLDAVNKELKKEPFASNKSNKADRLSRFNKYK